MENSAIAWTDDTFNPWVGCVKVSEGCKHCYAETLMKRYGRDVWGPGSKRERTSATNWKKPILWNKQAEISRKRRLVFCSSLADVFEDNPQVIEWRADLFQLIEKTRHLTWLLLTKRPENIHDMLPDSWLPLPPKNVWLGATIESQEVLDSRATALLSTPAYIHFFSIEPQLSPIDIWRYRPEWVIVGGESGAGCRPFQVEWARMLRDRCKESGIAFFMKQLGGYPNKRHEMSDFPADLQIREFPR